MHGRAECAAGGRYLEFFLEDDAELAEIAARHAIVSTLGIHPNTHQSMH
jgi:hypothetical protein